MGKRKSKDKDWAIDIDIKFTQIISAPTKKQAIDTTKISFLDDYNIDLTDEEIVKVRQRKVEKTNKNKLPKFREEILGEEDY